MHGRRKGSVLRTGAITRPLLAEARQHREAIAAELAHRPPRRGDVASSWGLTAAERTASLTQLQTQPSAVTAAAARFDTDLAANHRAPDAQPALVERVATEALDGYEAPEPLPDRSERECERLTG